MTYRALWNGAVLAESDATVGIEGNRYFPHESVRWEHFGESRTHTICPWKGRASYYHIVVDGQPLGDAAWTYPHPFPLARKIRGRVAFGNEVHVQRLDKACT